MRARTRDIFLIGSLLCFSSSGSALEPDQIYEKAVPSVVKVETFDTYGKVIGFGSGVVIAQGEVVTNCHVLEDGVRWRVTKGDQEASAKVRFYDKDRDLCQLSAPKSIVFTRPVRGIVSFDDLRVGQRVYAIGAPQGWELSLSEGIISALRRLPDDSIQLIQMTAAISPGSSGGGLFDKDARLIGLPSFLLKDSQNLNFAIPASWLLELSSRQSDLLLAAERRDAERKAVTEAAALQRRELEVRRREDEARASEGAADERLHQLEAAPQKPSQVTLPVDEYAQKIQKRIQRNVAYSSNRGSLVAEFTLSVMGSGWLVGATLSKSSGDGEFDAAALRTIWGADPLHDSQEVIRFEGIRQVRIALSSSIAMRPPVATGQAVAVAPLPSVPKRSRGDEDAALRRFQQEIVSNLGRSVSEEDYPRLAKERNWQGSPMIRVEIGEDGKLKLVTVAKTSGFSLLDERAVSKIKEIPLPKIPEEFRDRAFGVDVPFKFWLRDKDQ